MYICKRDDEILSSYFLLRKGIEVSLSGGSIDRVFLL
jgi:hypothetical protein